MKPIFKKTILEKLREVYDELSLKRTIDKLDYIELSEEEARELLEVYPGTLREDFTEWYSFFHQEGVKKYLGMNLKVKKYSVLTTTRGGYGAAYSNSSLGSQTPGSVYVR